MWWLSKIRRVLARRKPSAARSRKRHSTTKLTTELGNIADLSADGMRVVCTSRPMLAVNDTDTWFVGNGSQRVKVTGRIAWIRRESLNLWQVGVQFVNLEPAKRFALDLLARTGYLQPGTHNIKDLDPESLELLRAAQAAKANWESSTRGDPSQPFTPPHTGGHADTAASDPTAATSPGTAPGLSAIVHVEDLYAILDIPHDATDAQIKAAFRTIALQHHPDKADSPDSADLFVRANKAYKLPASGQPIERI
jgi:hypothetical protein